MMCDIPKKHSKDTHSFTEPKRKKKNYETSNILIAMFTFWSHLAKEQEANTSSDCRTLWDVK